jgi:hypothetical protein
LVKAAGRGDSYTELVLAEKFKDSPTVHATLELQTKAAMAVGSTTAATWVGPLAAYGIASEALVRGASIIGALEGKMRGRNGSAVFPRKRKRNSFARVRGPWLPVR